jgi:hypothetical protein
MSEPTAEDIAALKSDGDLKDYFLTLIGRAPAAPKAARTEPAKPSYHIPRPGAWPCGTAASGPTPKPCDDCHDGAAP